MNQDKETYYQNLNKELATELQTLPEIVSSIRTQKSKTKEEVMAWALGKVNLHRYKAGSKRAPRLKTLVGRRRKGKAHYQAIYNFLLVLKPEEWQALTIEKPFVENEGSSAARFDTG